MALGKTLAVEDTEWNRQSLTDYRSSVEKSDHSYILKISQKCGQCESYKQLWNVIFTEEAVKHATHIYA